MPSETESNAKTAVLVFHGMGQQVPFETLGNVATQISQSKFWEMKKPDPDRQLEIQNVPLQGGVEGGDASISRVRMHLKPTERSPNKEAVDFYECYWAPITEGKVNLVDALVFLLNAGMAGIKYSLRGCFDRYFWKEKHDFILSNKMTNIFSLALASGFIASLAVLSFCLLFLLASHALQHLAEVILASCQNSGGCPTLDWVLTRKLFDLDLFRVMQGEMLFLLRGLILLASVAAGVVLFRIRWKRRQSITLLALFATAFCGYHLIAAIFTATEIPHIRWIRYLVDAVGLSQENALFLLGIPVGQVFLYASSRIFSAGDAKGSKSKWNIYVGLILLATGFLATFARAIYYTPNIFLAPDFLKSAPILGFIAGKICGLALWIPLLVTLAAMASIGLRKMSPLTRWLWFNILLVAILFIISSMAMGFSFWWHWGNHHMRFWERLLAEGSLTSDGLSNLSKLWLVLYGAGAVALVLFIRHFLIEYVGDVAAYISSHKVSKFNDIRDRIQEEAFKAACHVYARASGYDKIILIGHSLGSVIAYDTLNGIINYDLIQSKNWDAAERTKLLLTFGSPLNKVAFIFRTQVEDNEIREFLAAAKQPLLEENHAYRPRHWINVWSPNDVISGPLNFFDTGTVVEKPSKPGRYVFDYVAKPKSDKTSAPAAKGKVSFSESRQRRIRPVIPIIDPKADIPLAAHTQFWNNDIIYRVVLRAIEDNGDSTWFDDYIHFIPDDPKSETDSGRA